MAEGTNIVFYVEEVEELKRKVNEYAEQISLLLVENEELRQQMSCAVSSDDVLPRKLPKLNCDDANISSESVVRADIQFTADDVQFTAVGGRGQKKDKVQSAFTSGVKKVMQAVNTNVLEVRKHILKANCSKFSLRQAGINAPVKIVVNEEAEIVRVREALNRAKLSYHEFKRNDEKQKCFIIKGLVGITEADLPEIKAELIEQGLPDTLSLSLFVTGFMRANTNKQHNLPVRMVLPPNIDIKVLDGVKYLNHVAISFEQFKSKSVIQCKNCQRFGHSAGGCKHEHRCVKCGVNHFRDACPRTFNSHHKLCCCNCGGEHTANNLAACEFFQAKYGVKARNAKVVESFAETPKQSIKLSGGSSKRLNGTTYAEMLRKPSFRNHNSFNVGSGKKHINVSKRTDLDGEFASKLEAKLDALHQMVLKHDKLFAKFFSDD